MSETQTQPITLIAPPKPKRIRKCHITATGSDGKRYRVTLDPLGWIVVRAHHSKTPMRHPVSHIITMMIRWHLGSLELMGAEEKGSQ